MSNTIESGTIAPPRPYPPSIARAADRATDDRLASVRALSSKARLTLQKIVRCISTSNITQSVRISRNLLADLLGVSTKTVSRIKAELENAGWIDRHQIQSRMYGMQVGDVWLTPWALQELQLLAPGPLDPVNMPVPSEDSIAIRAAVVPQQTPLLTKNVPRSVDQKCPTPYSLSLSLSERQPPSGQSLQDVVQEKSLNTPENVASTQNLPTKESQHQQSQHDKQQPSSDSNDYVPDDLITLKIVGISTPGIRKLMGIATRAGRFLGDIVQVATNNILKAKNPYCYVLKLISSKTDWQGKLAYQREQQFQQELMAKQALCGNQDLDTIQQAMARTGMLASYKRTHVWKLDDHGTVRKAEIAQLLTDPTLAHWQPLLDIAGLAQAIGEGKLFAVDMQDLRDMQGQGEQATPQPVCEQVPELLIPTTAATAPLAQPSKVQVTSAKPQQPQQPWHNLPQYRELDAIWAATTQSPDGLLSNHKQAKVWKIIDGWLKVTTVQELLNTKTAIINWQPLSAEGVVDFAKRLKQGQLFPVDKHTVQSWCSQPQPASAQPTTQASTITANVPDQLSPQPTDTQNWRTSLASFFNTAQGQFQAVGA